MSGGTVGVSGSRRERKSRTQVVAEGDGVALAELGALGPASGRGASEGPWGAMDEVFPLAVAQRYVHPPSPASRELPPKGGSENAQGTPGVWSL